MSNRENPINREEATNETGENPLFSERDVEGANRLFEKIKKEGDIEEKIKDIEERRGEVEGEEKRVAEERLEEITKLKEEKEMFLKEVEEIMDAPSERRGEAGKRKDKLLKLLKGGKDEEGNRMSKDTREAIHDYLLEKNDSGENPLFPERYVKGANRLFEKIKKEGDIEKKIKDLEKKKGRVKGEEKRVAEKRLEGLSELRRKRELFLKEVEEMIYAPEATENIVNLANPDRGAYYDLIRGGDNERRKVDVEKDKEDKREFEEIKKELSEANRKFQELDTDSEIESKIDDLRRELKVEGAKKPKTTGEMKEQEEEIDKIKEEQKELYERKKEREEKGKEIWSLKKRHEDKEEMIKNKKERREEAESRKDKFLKLMEGNTDKRGDSLSKEVQEAIYNHLLKREEARIKSIRKEEGENAFSKGARHRAEGGKKYFDYGEEIGRVKGEMNEDLKKRELGKEKRKFKEKLEDQRVKVEKVRVRVGDKIEEGWKVMEIDYNKREAKVTKEDPLRPKKGKEKNMRKVSFEDLIEWQYPEKDIEVVPERDPLDVEAEAENKRLEFQKEATLNESGNLIFSKKQVREAEKEMKRDRREKTLGGRIINRGLSAGRASIGGIFEFIKMSPFLFLGGIAFVMEKVAELTREKKKGKDEKGENK